jgi:hypothetical protein
LDTPSYKLRNIVTIIILTINVIYEDSCTRDIAHNEESATAGILKLGGGGALLIQKKSTRGKETVIRYNNDNNNNNNNTLE